MQECKNAADRGTEQAVVTAVIVVVRSGEEARVGTVAGLPDITGCSSITAMPNTAGIGVMC